MISTELDIKKYAHWKLIGTLLWGCAIFLFVQICVTALVVLTKASDYSEAAIIEVAKNLGQNGTLLSIFVIATMIFGGITIFLVIKFKKNSNLIEYLAINKTSYKSLLLWMGFTLGYVVFVNVVGLLFGRPIVNEFMSTIYKTASPMWLLWLALIVAAPIFEELFFRGFLFKGLVNSRLGLFGTIIFTAAVWAIIHAQYDYFDIGAIFIGGLFLGYARFKSNSILVPISMHGVANLVAILEATFL
jgi:uncharacterized protein